MPWTPETSRDMQRALHPTRPDFVNSFPADAFDAVVIEAAIAGNIMISGDATDEAQVTGRGYRFNSHLAPSVMEIVDRTLVIKAGSILSYVVGLQWGKLELLVRVPAHVSVRVRMFAGVIMLNGGTSAVDIAGLIGTVEGSTQARHVTIRVGLGEIQLADLHAQAQLRVGWGAIELLYRRFTGSEQVDARCGFGAVDLRLPTDVLPQPRDMAGVLRVTQIASVGGQIHAALGFGGMDLKPVA